MRFEAYGFKTAFTPDTEKQQSREEDGYAQRKLLESVV